MSSKIETSLDVSVSEIGRDSSTPLGMTEANMKSSLEAPEKQVSEETSAKAQKQAPASVIDTSKMSKGKREALELAEASRDPLDERGSFASNLFIGRYDFDRIPLAG